MQHNVSHALTTSSWLSLSSKVHGSQEKQQHKYFARHSFCSSRHVSWWIQNVKRYKKLLGSSLQAQEQSIWVLAEQHPFYRHCGQSLHIVVNRANEFEVIVACHEVGRTIGVQHKNCTAVPKDIYDFALLCAWVKHIHAALLLISTSYTPTVWLLLLFS